MRQDQIKVGGFYIARVSGNFVTVRVDGISEGEAAFSGRPQTKYYVTNMATKRKLVFRSAMKFRGIAPKLAAETFKE